MPNPRRGEVEARLGGRSYTLCLTLGALADMEAAFGAEDLQALGRRFGEGRVSAKDIVRILGAGLRGGGTALSDDEVAALPMPDGLEPVVDAAARLLIATFGSGAEGDASPAPPRPREPQDPR